MNISASEVTEGDYLVGLDNGYVFDVEDDAADALSWAGSYGGRFPEGMVLISFHDAYGDENYLILTNDHPIEIRRD